MKILPYADLHLEFDGSIDTVTRSTLEEYNAMATAGKQADVVVLAGDTYTKGRGPESAARMFPDKQIVMVGGNHEYYGQGYPDHLHYLQRKTEGIDGLHFLENEVAKIGDVVFIGCTLWTDCKLWESGPYKGLYGFKETIADVYRAMNDYQNTHYQDKSDKRGLVPQDFINEHLKSVCWLREQFENYRECKTVVVTHHAPSMRSIPDVFQQSVYSAAFASHLDELVEESGAVLWIHGHSHGFCDYNIGDTQVICNSRGYPHENTGFKTDMLIDV